VDEWKPLVYGGGSRRGLNKYAGISFEAIREFQNIPGILGTFSGICVVYGKFVTGVSTGVIRRFRHVFGHFFGIFPGITGKNAWEFGIGIRATRIGNPKAIL